MSDQTESLNFEVAGVVVGETALGPFTTRFQFLLNFIGDIEDKSRPIVLNFVLSVRLALKDDGCKTCNMAHDLFC